MKNRRAVHWSGWSLTRTIASGLEAGLEISEADYFMYLAGTDFQIENKTIITNFLDANYPFNFVNYYPLVPGIWGYGLIERYRLIDLKSNFSGLPHRGNLRPTQIKSGPLYTLLGRLCQRSEDALNRLFLPRKTSWTRLYSGSSRWCLNRQTAQFTVDYFNAISSRQLRHFLMLSANSDEIFFQTAVLNSEHSNQCIGFDEPEAAAVFANKAPAWPDEKRVYLHYIDWDPAREDPAILHEGDMLRLRRSGKFFASKFTDDRSLPLITLLQREVL